MSSQARVQARQIQPTPVTSERARSLQEAHRRQQEQQRQQRLEGERQRQASRTKNQNSVNIEGFSSEDDDSSDDGDDYGGIDPATLPKDDVEFKVGEFVKITAGSHQGQSGYIQIKIEGLEKNVFPVRIGYRTINVDGKNLVRAKQPSAGEKRKIDYAGRLPGDGTVDPKKSVQVVRKLQAQFQRGEYDEFILGKDPLIPPLPPSPTPATAATSSNTDDDDSSGVSDFGAPFSDLSLHRHQ